MWDLNHAERRALGGALLLVGAGLIARVALAPGPGDLEWTPQGDVRPDLSGVEGDVIAALAREQRAQTPIGPSERIDVNDAPAEELRRLPGIGAGLAEAIIRERQVAPFRRLDDIQRVAGIGEATARRLAPLLAFDTPTVGELERPVGLIRPPQDNSCAATGGLVDLNRATEAQLQRLPGIGPALAVRIMEERIRGPFRTPEALQRVPGIGPRSVADLADRVCTGTP